VGTYERGRGARPIYSNATAVGAALMLAACGGGGGSVSAPGTSAPPTSAPAPVPAPTPSPSPTPAPAPPPSAASTAEYQASGAAVLMKAAAAYDRGITGKGVTIAVLDTGINRASSEFAGRVSPDSTGFEQPYARCATCPPETRAPFPVDDRVGHGTQVASVALAARDGTGVTGVAPGATLLALKIVGLDLAGTAGTTALPDEGTQPNGQLIAPALRTAVDRGAFVSVLALNGGGGGPRLAAELRGAMDAVRAGDRLVVQSVSNATGEDSFARDSYAASLVGADLANKDWFLFAVGMDRNGVARPENGSAGALADRMLAAAGNGIEVVDGNGALVTVTGNSFAAPAVAGAAALLKERWPQLGGRAIGRILLDTARDAGAPGVDPVYGAGILDVERAMQAQAPASSFAAAGEVLARVSSLTVSAPFGGAAAAARLSGATSSMTVLDRYGRDYRMSGGTGPRTASFGTGLLAARVMGQVDPPWSTGGITATATRLGVAPAPVGPYAGQIGRRPAAFGFSPAAGQIATLSANAPVGSGSTELAGSPLRTFLAAPVGTSAAWTGGGWSASFSSGRDRGQRTARLSNTASASVHTVALSAPLGLGLELAEVAERGRALGMAGGAALGLEGGRTTAATVSLRRPVAGALLTARYTAATTRVAGGSDLLRFDGAVLSDAFALEAARPLLSGTATLGLSSPLRVRRARAVMAVPVAYDLITGVLESRPAAIDLAPAARELDLEVGWSAALGADGGSYLRLGAAHAFDAGHAAGRTDTAGFVTLVVR